ncbi:MAG TPA: DNA-3-methyladenine glycosylase 2 family protein [Acidimicrobiia bacterium]|nr:DNA-3-methyladenine glycosylase 2 family protein [Acidimicrobiia bacterium]
MLRRTIMLRAGVDLRSSLAVLVGGRHDPVTRLEPGDAWLGMRTPLGPATLHLSGGGTRVEAEAWGPGESWAIEHAPDTVGARDDAFVVDHPVVGPLARRHHGLRVIRSARVVALMVRTVLEQKVTGRESKQAWRRLVRKTSEPAPGPRGDLLLPPDPAVLAAMAYHRFHPFGVERRRAETIIRVARHARRLEETASMPLPDAYRRLQAIHGIGPWTAALVAGAALGDADAVPVGDYHLPNTVAWALAGEARADDDRMLELLEPFAGQRGRVVRLLKAGGISAPKFGPRHEIRSIERI